MHFPNLHGEQHDYIQYVSKASDLWSSNSTSKNYCQENNHGYVEKLTDKQCIVQTRKRDEREECLKQVCQDVYNEWNLSENKSTIFFNIFL